MILITGATGNNGREIVQGLQSSGERVRAMVRKTPKEGVLPPEVEIAVADFDDPESLRKVLAGVDRVFLVTPSSERVEEQQLRFVALARDAGVKHVVYLSQLHAATDSPVRFLRYHAAIERALEESGMAFTHLRPNLYMQGLLLFKQLIAKKGQIIAPIGEARVSLVDVRDIAAVAIAALTSASHSGKTYDLTGPEALTHVELASQLSQALGKPIEFVDISVDDFRQTLLTFHMPDWQADGLVEDYAHYRRGEASAISSAVKDVTGKRPRSFSGFAHDYREQFLA